MQKQNAKSWQCFLFTFKILKLYHALKMHYTWVNLDLIHYIKTTNWSKNRLTEPRNNQQRKARNPSLGAHNDKNHCKLIKASDNQPLSKDRLEKQIPRPWSLIWTETLYPIIPNRPSYFSMQTENKPSKWNPRAFEKAQSVVTKGIQTSNTAFITKINS